jgi:hypothetical protein
MNVNPCRRPGCGRKGKSKRIQLIGPFLGADYALLGEFIHVGRDIRIGQLGPFQKRRQDKTPPEGLARRTRKRKQ